MLDEFLDPGADILSLFRPNEHVDGLDVRAGSEQLLDEHFAEESRAARDEHAPVSVEFA